MTGHNRGRPATTGGFSMSGPARTGPRQPGPLGAPDAAAAAVVFGISLALLLAAFQTYGRHPWSMIDLRVYVWGGGLAGDAQDPYLHTYMHFLNFTYTPVAAGFFALMALVKLPVIKGLVTAASIASLVAVLWLTDRKSVV